MEMVKLVFDAKITLGLGSEGPVVDYIKNAPILAEQLINELPVYNYADSPDDARLVIRCDIPSLGKNV